MGVSVRIHKGKIYLDIWYNGRRKWESLGLTVPADRAQKAEIMRLAEICKSKREAQILSGEWGLFDPVVGKQSLYDYVEGIAAGRGQNDFSHKALRYLKSFPGGNASIGSVNEQWLEDFQEYLLKDTKLSKKTASHYYGAVKFALGKATRDRIIPRNPAKNVRGVSVPESERVYLTMGELQNLASIQLQGELNAEVRRAFIFACYTGLRISDLKSISWGDVQREPLQINKTQEKTGRKAFVPLHGIAWGLINDNQTHGGHELIFPVLSATKTNTNEYLKRWAAKASISKNIGWHTARHTFAVNELDSGADIYTLSKLLGHTDIKATQIYAAATDPMKRRAVNALPGIDLVGEGSNGAN